MKLYKKKVHEKQGQAKQKKRNEIWEKWEILQKKKIDLNFHEKKY